MQWIRNAKMNRKLLLMIVLPMLGLLFFSLSAIMGKVGELTEVGKLQRVVSAEISINDMIHELLMERGLVFGYLTQKSPARLDAMMQQRKLTDDKVNVMHEFAKSSDARALGDQFGKDLAGSIANLDKLTAMRSLIDQDMTNTDDSKLYYLDTVESFFNVMENSNRTGSSKQIGDMLTSYIHFSRAKFAVSRERALVYHIILDKGADKSELLQMNQFENEQIVYDSVFKAYATPASRSLFQNTVKGQAVAEADRFIQLVINSNPGDMLGMDAEKWYSMATEKVDLLKQVEDTLSKELQHTMEAAQASSIRSLITVIAINIVIILASMLAIIAIARLMVAQIRSLQHSTELILKGETDVQIDVNSKDEFGVLMSAFNQMAASFREVITQADRISLGEYEQTIIPRSERDQLSIALIRMLASLKQTTEENERQFWLKTQLARLTGMAQGVTNMRQLVGMLISEIAQLVEAGQGIIYVKDMALDEEAVPEYVLLGSYAYRERKHMSGRIRPGEGLVGQSVLERKPILLTNVPGDYIQIRSGLGEARPLQIQVLPISFEGEVLAVLELASFQSFTEIQHELLDQLAESLGVIIQSVNSRHETEVLLRKSQQLAEELQTQQEELRTANEELEEQASILKQSEEKMRIQSEELQAINEELEDKTNYLSMQKADIEKQNRWIQLSKQELEEKAKELELASKYKSEFLANMSHELRTPLNSLLILAKSLAGNDEGNLSEDQIESAKIIYSGGQDLLTLINDILDLSKVEAGKLNIQLEEVRVDAILQSLKHQFMPVAKEKSLEFGLERGVGVPDTIVTDGLRTEQILKNLLSNAFKFTSTGSIVVTVALVERSDAEAIAFTVTDTGIGIPMGKQKAIFEAFQQADGTTSRKYGGTGLGLTISRELSKLLGGEIHMQSEEGKGSSFTLYLPLGGAAAAVEAVPPTTSEALVATAAQPVDWGELKPSPGIPAFLPDDRELLEAPVKEKTILIVEDDPSFAKILMNMSRKKGFRCLAAGDGFSALKLAKQYIPSAVLLDLGLPDMDGMKVLDHLKYHNETRHIPVHIISVKDMSFDSLQRGAIGFLSKPIRTEDIEVAFAKIENVLLERIQQVLVVEDDLNNQLAIHELLKHKNVELHSAYSGQEGLDRLRSQTFDCVILDLALPDMTGFEMLQQLVGDADNAVPPIIINTGKELSQEEYKQLARFTNSIVIKGANSPDRLLDEVSLFLHSVHKSLPPEHKEMIRMVRDSDETLQGRKVLLVDDDLRNTFALSKVLRKHGLEVVMADNGRLALDKLEADEGIELVIMDIMMPVMDGYEAMERIRAMPKHRSLPIIALTAKAMTGDREKCIERGANDYLTKPVDTDKLLSLIRVWLFR